MMISPEGYCEMILNGKSQECILEEIRSLRKEIKRLKQYIEEHFFEPEAMFPSRLTQLKCNREYLDRAIQAYREAGGQYVHGKEEQKSMGFEAALDAMQKLVFSIGGNLEGYETWTYTISDDKVILDADHALDLKPVSFAQYYAGMKDEFIAGLKELHIGEWKKDYNDLDALDGTQWELEIYLGDAREPIRISGHNAFPYNFKDLLGFLGIDKEIENNGQDQD